MKIYFVGSISGRDKYLKNYKAIIKALQDRGHTVFEDTVRPSKEEVYSLQDSEKVDFYKQVLDWMNKADVMVAEASYSSLGVGHEISTALHKSKPVVVLYEEGHAPHFLEGVTSDKLVIEKYRLDNVAEVVSEAVEYAAEQQDTRFNFFVSPRISNYLDWVAKHKRLPRAVYLRKLIEDDMAKREDD